ncbi:hypothetical protein IT084_12545 [Desulfallas sp. Bu1-1]|nr:hypothetical protein [Desulfallas sp. Bu1-1]
MAKKIFALPSINNYSAEHSFLDRVEKEVTSRDYRITGFELVCCNEKRNRVHLVVSVARGERQEIRLPVSRFPWKTFRRATCTGRRG